MHLPIFPRAGFDQSVTTPVLVGVLVSWFFTETFGWVFAGLVVPGYLAAVFLLDPAGGVADVGEAIATYALARLVGEHVSRTGLTSRVFGRERFFLVVLMSIIVRLVVEAWLLPRVTGGAAMYSVGLVVVPLAANACWKTGLSRGLVQNGVPTLITYVVLRFVLAKYTNLSLAGFELATENVAASFLASPKAYIFVVTGALLAASANLRYGWDFNGILVPALLGLALFEPVKFASTFAETLALYLIVVALVRLTPLRRANIEGPRRTVLFFTADYAVRFAFAWAMGSRLPGGDIVSFMGFGYLLPTLLAVKISQKASAPLVLLPTLKVSVAGFALATLIGFGAVLVDHAGAREAEARAGDRPMAQPPRTAAAAALWASALALDNAPEPDASVTGDLAAIGEVLARAAEGQVEPARRAGLVVSALEGDVLLARERFDAPSARRGAPAYLFRAGPRREPVVVLVPTPIASPAVAAAAGALVARGDADAAVIAGVEGAPGSRRAWLETSAHAAARWLARGGTLVTLYGANAEPAPNAVAPALPESTRRAMDAASRFVPLRAMSARGGEVVAALDEMDVARVLAPVRAPMALDSSTAIASALEDAHLANGAAEFEHVIALRRFVLEPLLSPAASDRARALAPFAADALGYRLSAPSRFGAVDARGEGVALVPVERGRPVALVARVGGVRGRVVEAPGASRAGVRDVALRFAIALDADAVVLGASWDDRMRAGAARAAHAAATEGGDVEVFVVHADEALARGATLGAWMDDGRAVGAARRALERLGIEASDAPADLETRELASHTLPRPVPLVTLKVSAEVEAAGSLEAARRARARFSDAPISTRDGAVAEAAAALLAGLDARAPPAPDGVVEAARHAVAEESVTAFRTLVNGLRGTSMAAGLVRAAEGTFLVAVARTPTRTAVVAAPFEGGGEWRVERRESVERCVGAPILGGACEVGKRQ